VRAAAELDVVDRHRATICVWLDVVELEARRFHASASSPYEGASPVIAPPHRPFDRSRHVSAMTS
jgi:hypothetical protein